MKRTLETLPQKRNLEPLTLPLFPLEIWQLILCWVGPEDLFEKVGFLSKSFFSLIFLNQAYEMGNMIWENQVRRYLPLEFDSLNILDQNVTHKNWLSRCKKNYDAKYNFVTLGIFSGNRKEQIENAKRIKRIIACASVGDVQGLIANGIKLKDLSIEIIPEKIVDNDEYTIPQKDLLIILLEECIPFQCVRDYLHSLFKIHPNQVMQILYLACIFNKLEIAKSLINSLIAAGKALDEIFFEFEVEERSITPLEIASKYGYLGLVQFLHENGQQLYKEAAPEIPKYKVARRCEFLYAIKSGNLFLVEYYCQNIPRETVKNTFMEYDEDNLSYNVLNIVLTAAESGHLEILKFLLEEYDVLIGKPLSRKFLHSVTVAAIKSGSVPMIEYLSKEKGVSLTEKLYDESYYDASAIFYAVMFAKKNRFNLVKYLHEKKGVSLKIEANEEFCRDPFFEYYVEYEEGILCLNENKIEKEPDLFKYLLAHSTMDKEDFENIENIENSCLPSFVDAVLKIDTNTVMLNDLFIFREKNITNQNLPNFIINYIMKFIVLELITIEKSANTKAAFGKLISLIDEEPNTSVYTHFNEWKKTLSKEEISPEIQDVLDTVINQLKLYSLPEEVHAPELDSSFSLKF